MSREIDTLIDAYFDGELNAADSARLAELLDSDASAGQQMVKALHWHRALATVAHQQCLGQQLDKVLPALQPSAQRKPLPNLLPKPYAFPGASKLPLPLLPPLP